MFFFQKACEKKTHLRFSSCEVYEKRAQKVGCLGYVGDEILPSYRNYFMNHYKNPYY